MARRLVEVGVPFVEVDFGGWDNHSNIFPTLADNKLTMLDQGMSALVEDLDQRGMLQDTVVIWMGEFGRTPRINKQGGRDHWPRVSTALLAGGGMRTRQVIGATDRLGGYPVDAPQTPENMAASIYQALGLPKTLLFATF